MSNQGMPPYQPPHEPNISGKTFATIIAIVFIVVVGAALAVIFLSGSGGGSGSPKAALIGYADGINDGSMKEATDHTLLRFMPNYEQMLSPYENISFEGMITVEISNVSVVYESSMTSDQLEEARDLMNEINMTMDITIQEVAFVEFTMAFDYVYGQFSVPSDMLTVKVDGHWYLAMFSVPDLLEF
jgi:hypothetical protein